MVILGFSNALLALSFASLSVIPVVRMIWNWIGPNSLRRIPAIGTSIPGLSYINGLRYLWCSEERLLSGYAKYAYTTGIFKVPLPDQWLVVIAGPQQIAELKKMSDDQISSYGGLDEMLAGRFLFGKSFRANPYHLQLIQNQLNRNLSDFYPAIKDEMWTAFPACIGEPDEWESFPAYSTATNLVLRISNRVIVGPSFCKDPRFLEIAVEYTRHASRSRTIVNLFPPIFKPFIAKFVNTVPSQIKRAKAIIGETIEERRNMAKQAVQSGEKWEDKPNDLMMWLIDEAVEHGYSTENTILYLLNVEFIALHTTSMSFTQALYHLAADPSLATPLREEVEMVLEEEHGDLTSKTAISKLNKMDSFLRESQRLNGPNATSIWRTTVQRITFSNGVTIPAGTFICAPASATHLDENIYENAPEFDPWRHVEAGPSHKFASTTDDYTVFGQGKHACPGRHFAAYTLKLMLSYIVLHYDVKLDPAADGVRPQSKWIGNAVVPNSTANVLFRKRETVVDL